MSTIPSSQVAVWHDLFRQGPPNVLVQMIQEGMVPAPCLLPSGQDLLKTLLLRECPGILGNSRAATSHKEPRLGSLWSPSGYEETWKSRLDYQRVAVLLLERSDIQVFEEAPLDQLTSLGLAVDAGLAAVAEAMFGRMTLEQKQAIQERAVAEQWVHRAAARNALPLLEVLLENGCSAVSLDPSGRTPLFHATNVEVAQRLLDHGARLNETAGKITLVEHWARALRAEKYGNASLEALIEMGRQASLAPQQKLALDMVRAVSWFENVNVSVHKGQQGFGKKGDEWEHGWKDVIEPLLAVAPAMHTWQRSQDSGLLKGNVTLAAALGGRWLSCVASEKNQEQPFGMHLGLMEKPERLLGAEPTVVRRGVTDWGLWALGALVAKPELNQRETQDIKDLAARSQKELERIMAMRAPAERWNELALQTAATLQRPQNRVMWKRIGSCLEEMIDRGIRHEQDKRSRMHGGQKLAIVQGNYQGWLVAHQALEAGVRMCSGFNSVGLLKRVIEWGRQPSLTALEALPKEKFNPDWFVLGLTTFVDHAVIAQREQSAFSKSHAYNADLKVLVELLNQYTEKLDRLPEIPAAAAARVEDGLPLLRAYDGQLPFSRWKEQKLEDALEAQFPAESMGRKGPRL